MWFDLTSDLRDGVSHASRSAPGTSALIVADARARHRRGDDRVCVRGPRAVPRPAGRRQRRRSSRSSRRTRTARISRARVSAPDLLDYRARTHDARTAVGDARRPRAADPERPVADADRHLRDGRICLPRMGQSPLVGRVFRTARMSPERAPVAVLSHHYWRDEFGSRADAIGRTLQIGREIVTVVGVMTPDIEFGNIAEIDLWLPLNARARRPARRQEPALHRAAAATARRSIRPRPNWRRSATRSPPNTRSPTAAGSCGSSRFATSPAARASGWSSRCSCCRSAC